MSREIGAIIDLATAYGRGVLRGISEQARAAGDWGVTHILAKAIDWTGSLDEQLPGLAGAIIQSPIGGPPLDSLRTLRLPAVSVADHAEQYGMPTVRPDHVAIGAMGAEFFLRRGFRNLGYIGRARETYACLRHEGFVNAARAAGVESLEFWVLRDRGEDWGAGVASWISALAKPVGVLVCDDSLARLVGHFAKLRSIAIPEQVALLGVDDDKDALSFKHHDG
jgi:LacI family transcriptional regulator